jgi:hypothetical protein
MEGLQSLLGFTKDTRLYVNPKEPKRVQDVSNSVLAYLKTLPPLEDPYPTGEMPLIELQSGRGCARRHSWPNVCTALRRECRSMSVTEEKM